MALSPDDIERRTFAVLPEGYDVDEVRTFLLEVAATVRLALHSTQPPSALAPPADVTRWPERPHPGAADGAEPVAHAEVEARDVLRRAHAAAAVIHDQAKRVLTTAQDQATAIVEDAELTAREIVASAAGHAEDHIRASTERAQRHAEEVLRTERDTLDRLRTAQDDVGAAIERIARADTRPVVDLRKDIGDLRFGISAPTSGGVPRDAGAAASEADVGRQPREQALTRRLVDTGDPADVAATDPTLVLMRNAVSRAIDAAARQRAAAADARPSEGVAARGAGTPARPEH